MKKMLYQKIQVLKSTLEKPTQNNKFNEKLYNEMLCMCVCKINKKICYMLVKRLDSVGLLDSAC